MLSTNNLTGLHHLKPLRYRMRLRQLSCPSMADPVSATASIITVIQVAGSLIAFVKDLKDTTAELRDVLAELNNLHNVLNHVLECHRAADRDGQVADILPCSRVPLKECEALLKRLRKKLESMSNFGRTRKVMTWKLQQTEIKNILSRIERQKALLNTSLHIETRYVLHPDSKASSSSLTRRRTICKSTRNICLENGQGISALRDDIAELYANRAGASADSAERQELTVGWGASGIPRGDRASSGSAADSPVNIRPGQVKTSAEGQELIPSRQHRAQQRPESRQPVSRYLTSNKFDEPSDGPQVTDRMEGRGWTTVCHYGNNTGGANVIYGGSQVFLGASVFFGTA